MTIYSIYVIIITDYIFKKNQKKMELNFSMIIIKYIKYLSV